MVKESKSQSKRKAIQQEDKPEYSYGVEPLKEVVAAMEEVKRAVRLVDSANAENKPIDLYKNLNVLKDRVDTLETLISTLLN